MREALITTSWSLLHLPVLLVEVELAFLLVFVLELGCTIACCSNLDRALMNHYQALETL